jgi:23S rRNA pseudouridine1911/1915/1917 synthase
MNNTPQHINLRSIIPPDYAGLRLDQAIAKLFPEHSRARLQEFIRKKQVSVNGEYKRPRDKVNGGEEIIIEAELKPEQSWLPQMIALDVIYEDETLLVINKPVGLVVHPAVGNRAGTLLNALLHHADALVNLPRAGIVHRLDKDTSGIMVVAKTLTAHTNLVKQLQKRGIEREYRAVVCGVMTAGGTIKASIGRHPTQRTKMAVVSSGKNAITHFRVLEKFRAHTYIKVNLETGRTHQIRVHMAHSHYPLLGDATYNHRIYLPAGATSELLTELQGFRHQALHAYRLQLVHPETQETMSWSAPLPNDFIHLLDILRADYETLAEESS